MNSNYLGGELEGEGDILMKQKALVSLKYSCDKMLEKNTMEFLKI